MLRFPNKKIRAEVIRDYLKNTSYEGVVCFSCGNASQALKDAGLDVVDISPKGDLEARRWWYPEEIQRVWPNRFDATSGHLSVSLMHKIGLTFQKYLGVLDYRPLEVPCGSGETLVSLKLAYPHHNFIAVYDYHKPETTLEAEAPLNTLVRILAFDTVILGVDK